MCVYAEKQRRFHDPYEFDRDALHRHDAAFGDVSGRNRVLLDGSGSQGGIASLEVAVDTTRRREEGQGWKTEIRRVVVDQCVVRVTPACGACGALVSLALGKRRLFQNL
jgi:hypothetical protein